MKKKNLPYALGPQAHNLNLISILKFSLQKEKLGLKLYNTVHFCSVLE